VLIARDSFNNPIPAQTLIITMNSPDLPGQILLNGSVNALTQTTNAQGELAVTFAPSKDANDSYQILIKDGDIPNGYNQILTLTVLGFPSHAAKALGLGEDRIPVNSTIMLDVNTTLPSGATSMQTFYRVDGKAWIPYNPTTGIMALDASRGYLVFDETRSYNIEWYSQICYDVACSNPVDERAVNGAPNFRAITTYQVENKLNGYPSPFNPKAASGDNFLTIQFPLSTVSSVETDIYDLFGQKVWHNETNATPDTSDPANPHGKVFWFGINDDGLTVANGGYVVRTKIGATGQIMKTKILVVK
jgi:hypothetical protein